MRLPTGLWKFAYWPITWAIIFLPAMMLGHICPVSGYLAVLSRVSGIAILAWALIIHIIAGRTLKRLGHSQRNTSLWPDRLVIDGIYSCMRHPQHLGLALMPVGIALVLASPIAMILSGWGVWAAFLFVLVIEEPECLKKFGIIYYRYMETTPAFSLKPSCIISGLNKLKLIGRDVTFTTKR
jgi:protein-S-isoprenylcysteine O-methyltransferase Ste14